MKKILLFLALLASLSIASAVEILPQNDGSVFIKLSLPEAVACMNEGGCAVVTARGLQNLQQQAVIATCGSSS